MNNQEIYTKSARHLLKQKRRSITTSGSCVYRSKGNLRCAVGALISDKDYRKNMEARSVKTLYKLYPDLPVFKTHERFIERRIHLLANLQNIHDNFLPRYWKEKLKDLAKQFNLKSI